jgi:hypothetical protein
VTPAAAALLIAAVAVTACDGRPLRSCDQSIHDLPGVWTVEGSNGGRRYQLLGRDRAPGVDLFPLWDTTRLPDGAKAVLPTDPAEAARIDLPVLSPLRIQLGRVDKDQLSGIVSQRVTRRGLTCTMSAAARLHGCAGDRATLTLDPLPSPMELDPATCAGSLQAGAASPISVPLRRE